MTLNETIAALTAAGYEAVPNDSDCYSKLIDGFLVYIEDRAGTYNPWGVSVWCDETNDELAVEQFETLDEALAFPIKFIDRLAAESSI